MGENLNESVSDTAAHENYPGIVERVFDTGELHLNYAEGPANGPPLLLLHGLGRRWQVFLPLIPALSLRWQIFAPDLRGHGKSSHVPRGYQGPRYCEDVVRFLREQVAAPAVIFGHSLGGMLAMRIAAQEPGLVRALILGDNRIVFRSFDSPMYAALFAALRDLARIGGSIEQIAEGIGKIVLPAPGTKKLITIRELPGNDQAYLLAWAHCVRNADPDTYGMTLDGSSQEGWDGEQLLRGIACPTLLLQAAPEMGGLMLDTDVDLAKRLLHWAAHVKFQNLGHALFIQQPEPVLRALTDFLAAI